jgi:hypothetical protein
VPHTWFSRRDDPEALPTAISLSDPSPEDGWQDPQTLDLIFPKRQHWVQNYWINKLSEAITYKWRPTSVAFIHNTSRSPEIRPNWVHTSFLEKLRSHVTWSSTFRLRQLHKPNSH